MKHLNKSKRELILIISATDQNGHKQYSEQTLSFLKTDKIIPLKPQYHPKEKKSLPRCVLFLDSWQLFAKITHKLLKILN
jgi:hypothetical protein